MFSVGFFDKLGVIKIGFLMQIAFIHVLYTLSVSITMIMIILVKYVQVLVVFEWKRLNEKRFKVY